MDEMIEKLYLQACPGKQGFEFSSLSPLLKLYKLSPVIHARH